MVHLSNKSIVYLLAIALVLTLASMVLNISKLGTLGNMITGAATNTSVGTATLTVTSQTAVTLRVSSIAFGSGYVNITNAACGSGCSTSTMSGHTSGNATCCNQFNNVTAGFFVENTGNENVTINFTCSGSCTAASFVNGTNPTFDFIIVNSSDGASTGKTSNNSGDSTTDTTSSCSSGSGGWNYSSWTAMAASTFDLCGSNGSTEYYFGAQPTRNAMIMDVRVTIPRDAITGSAKTATVTFSAASAG